jgi:hypothetical protein
MIVQWVTAVERRVSGEERVQGVPVHVSITALMIVQWVTAVERRVSGEERVQGVYVTAQR